MKTGPEPKGKLDPKDEESFWREAVKRYREASRAGTLPSDSEPLHITRKSHKSPWESDKA